MKKKKAVILKAGSR